MKQITDQEIIERLKLQDIPPEARKRVLHDVHETVELRTLGLVSDLLKEDQLEEFSRVKKDGFDTVRTWLSGKIGNLDEMYNSALEDYLNEVVKK